MNYWLHNGSLLIQIAALGGLVGWMTSSAILGLFTILAGLVIWLIHLLDNLKSIYEWSNNFSANQTPMLSGLWEALASNIYKKVRESKKNKQQQTLLLINIRKAAQAHPDGVVMLNSHFQTIWANTRAIDLLGIQIAKDGGQNLLNLIRHPRFVSYVESADWDSPVIIENIRGLHRMISLQLIPYGSKQRMLLCKDITQLQKLESMRQDFLGNVSHELKTPLTVLKGYLETIAEVPLDEDKRQGYIQILLAQTQRMQNIVNDLLTLTQLETAPYWAEEDSIDMPSLVEQAIEDAELLSNRQHSIELTCDYDLKLMGEERQIISVINNLITNAVRYTPSGGKITVSWGLNEQQCAQFSVRDNGVGISKEHLPHLIERFYRVDPSRSRESGGTGLGLAIVSQILTRHQAELEIESTPSKGSNFTAIFSALRTEHPQVNLGALKTMGVETSPEDLDVS